MAAIQLTLTTTSVSLLAALRAVDATIPGECRTLLLQSDLANAEDSRISVGDSALNSTRYGYQFAPGDNREYSSGGGNLEPRVPMSSLWVMASTDGLKLNVEVLP